MGAEIVWPTLKCVTSAWKILSQIVWATPITVFGVDWLGDSEELGDSLCEGSELRVDWFMPSMSAKIGDAV